MQDLNILADCGEGTARQLLKHKASKDFLDTIIITHYHPDHVAGLFMVIQMLYLQGRKKPLQVYLPENPELIREMLHTFYTFEQRFAFQLMLKTMMELERDLPRLKALPNDHLQGYRDVIEKNRYQNPMQAFSLEFREKGKHLIYTSDLGSLNPLLDNLHRADLIIMDALHPAADSIAGFAATYKGRLILTHGISPSLKNWLAENPRENIELAVENRTYEC
jgi:ribonuclease Z